MRMAAGCALQAAKAALNGKFPVGVEVEFLEECAGEPLKGNIMVVQPGEAEVGGSHITAAWILAVSIRVLLIAVILCNSRLTTLLR